MKYKKTELHSFNPAAYASALLLFIVGILMAPVAMALTVTVTGVDNAVTPATEMPGVTGYRWLIEEDKTYHVPLCSDGSVSRSNGANCGSPDLNTGAPDIDPNWTQPSTVSVSFHQSYMPVVAKGTEGLSMPVVCTGEVTDPANCLNPTKNYFISVLAEGYSIGGAPIKAGDDAVTVYVNMNPIPTAQISVFVHADNAPINNVWDLGEQGLEGFSIILEDAGGKYGASAGIQSQDAFGNPLCTGYVQNNQGAYVVDVMGAGCVTGADGRVTIKNLAPGKYGVLAVPPNAVDTPAGSGNYVSTTWTQTSTIEGTKLIDAWVKANEPIFFGEFGPPGPHVSIGFVPAGPNDPYIAVDADGNPILSGGATISGQVVNLHLSRPPDTAFYNGGPFPHTTPWVGLNLGAAGLGKGVYAARANSDGTFSIDNVPAGDYQLVVWDDNLDILFAKNTVKVDTGESSCNNGLHTSCQLGDIPVFQWFARMENYIYNDENENGVRDGGELGMIEQAVNLRFRDGTIYQSFPTDGDGFAPFDQVFPFFSWLVAEVDFARFKATGLTVTVDDGGPIGAPAEGAGTNWNQVLTPQIQNFPIDVDSIFPIGVTNPTYRTELGPVLSQGVQAFLGQTNVFEWGKKAYGPDENGGISGVVMYAVTRAENDPEQAAAEPWEPGIPGVTVNLHEVTGFNPDGSPIVGAMLDSTTSDSWDDSLPTNCQFGVNDTDGALHTETDDPFVFRDVDTDCYDGLRNWNQVRPGVFDGGYAFGPEIDCPLNVCPPWVNQSATDPSIGYIKPAQYVVEVVAPIGYEIIKSQDRNVDFGDVFFPSPELLPAQCVNWADAEADDMLAPGYGIPGYRVPAELSLFPGEPAPLAGQDLPLCDRKLVALSNGANAAADFSLFTEVPIAGHFIGFILDDTANEFDATSPQFGEKYAPPFLPVSIRDWTGREISRTVSDEYGVYNALIPSTFTENLSQPSGISPNMLTTCMNAKKRVDGTDDPLHNPQYSQFCYTFQYMPGSTTYLDTPVVPVAAFAGADQFPLDCEYIAGTPKIHSVSVPANGVGGGPYMATNNQGDIVNGDIVITSMGTQTVPNPGYDGVGGVELKTIDRDYGFGDTAGTLSIGGVAIPTATWSDASITATVAGIDEGAHQLVVSRADGTSTITGVTVQVGLRQGADVVTVPGDHATIQAAIQAAGTNDLILVEPGTYDELVIMWKPVQLQGWGEGSTSIDAIKAPFNKLSDWRLLIESLVDNKAIDIVDGQELGFGGIEPAAFFSEEGAGVLVVAKSNGNRRFSLERNWGARIDGFNISGADTGGGIVLNGFADFMEVSNNRVVNNSAFFAGGVRVGHPMLTAQDGNDLFYSDAENNNVSIHHNTITQNGGLDGAGGGMALHTGSDNYQVTENFVCGNFTNASGAGIAHYGLSENGLIKNNTVLFNENFNQGIEVNGGGILVSGLPALGCPFLPDTNIVDPICAANPQRVLTPGSGSVEISANLIKGNSAGAGDGAGIRLSRIDGHNLVTIEIGNGNNAEDVFDVDSVHVIDVINNMIVNNVAALSGGGISLQEALDINILHNTIANNDITSTSSGAFITGTPTQSVPQPGAGIISRGNSSDLTAHMLDVLVLAVDYPDTELVDNIIWHNRQFFWMSDTDPTDVAVTSGLCSVVDGDPTACGTTNVYDDLAVGTLPCTDCILTGADDPAFVKEYFNGDRSATTTLILEGTTSMQAPPAFDEGGNFIRLRYGPLTQTDSDQTATTFGDLLGDYHIQATGSSALNAASDIVPAVTTDFDGQGRPGGGLNDIGADEVQ